MTITASGETEVGRKAAAEAQESAQDIAAGKPLSYLDMNNYATDEAMRVFGLLNNRKTKKLAMKEIKSLKNNFANTGGNNDGTSGMILTRLQGLGLDI